MDTKEILILLLLYLILLSLYSIIIGEIQALNMTHAKGKQGITNGENRIREAAYRASAT